ncbi:unnamed protein product [Acanthoscelides obtectus]|uniref:Phosphatidylinositol-specific phospholipase C X domain-containing protein n=1 Tax=Acanthoscelides obtectus TaxID=200917 RepID=A0A9P0L4X5_ACAOB|nr:unnamed protein product [Acanthoscelides obtectus]CAK1675014.1 PI-PLC X domain-containing protein 2 [Acanthoscelides obtectus]
MADDGDLAMNLEFWMTNLPQKLKSVPVIHLAIPGSHDSFTSSITMKSRIAPDADNIIKKMSWLGPLLKYFMVNWSRTQSLSAMEQLEKGIRYFDLRIATKRNTNDLYIVHGLYADKVQNVLDTIVSFLESHPQEVIAVYRSDAARFGQPMFWPSCSFPNPWPNTVSTTKLFAVLDYGLKNRKPNNSYISQCILTPSYGFIITHLFSTLKQKCATDFEKQKLDWIDHQKPGETGMNVVITDFVELSDCKYVKDVINLNELLLNMKSSDTVVTTLDEYAK